MLQLINIKKDYMVASTPVTALQGINLTFKENEFVSILGPSGSGKTTLLNLIGGLDRYTSGDLLIDGKSTKDFSSSDWDSYRNTTIGFVFQNYNLIPHLSVLDNVIIALKLSGISAKESRERAINVLTEVGLKDHIYKRPNQLSGGQMQRVAIARALVNDPKILLADEPTGALDSKTSVQIMDLIKRISKDRLVIMVTHNGALADQYSDRIIRLLDGKVIEDTNPQQVTPTTEVEEKMETKKVSMPYSVALKTSFNNLLSKKWRTLITMVAGSIGIIGIALVLSISSGMNRYVERMQSDVLAGFPLQISENHTDYEAMMRNSESQYEDYPDNNIIYPYSQETQLPTHTNILDEDFLNYLEALDPSLYNSISYSYRMPINILVKKSDDQYKLLSSISNRITIPTPPFYIYFSQLPNNPEFIQSQYDILHGKYPEKYNELVLIVDQKNRLNTTILETFGIPSQETYRFEDFIGQTFKVIPNDLMYVKDESGFYDLNTEHENMYTSDEAIDIEIVGILRINPDASGALLNPGIGYTTFLTEHLMEDAKSSEIVQNQMENKDTVLLKGHDYEEAMRIIGGDPTPSGIQIYPVSFKAKEKIKDYIENYNIGKSKEQHILMTDMAEMLTKAISRLINTIAIVLSAFAGISLVVSSVMIGIITYVSVVERTKEIGIMRSIGARKKDISRIFNAETMIVGFGAGFVGILVAYLLTIPINLIIGNLTGVAGFSYLPPLYALLLIILSTVLTTIAGLIPSGIAARKDPVVALRTE